MRRPCHATLVLIAGNSPHFSRVLRYQASWLHGCLPEAPSGPHGRGYLVDESLWTGLSTGCMRASEKISDGARSHAAKHVSCTCTATPATRLGTF